MVTVRSYSNAAQAALAKSLLDDYEILCALADENSHLYTYGVAPVRLMVDEDQAEKADQLLSGHPELAAELDEKEEVTAAAMEPEPESRKRKPWELLMIAFYFLAPSICILLIRTPPAKDSSGFARYVVARVDTLHLLAWLGIAFAGYLIVLYFRVLRLREPAKDGQEATANFPTLD